MDLGGTTGWGRAPAPAPDEPVFAQDWEARAFALTVVTMGQVAGRNLDAFRYALARLDHRAYFDQGYSGRWLHAAELMLTDSAILAPGAVDARARRLAGADVEEPPVPEPRRPDYASTGPGSLRDVPDPPLFTIEENVLALGREREGHTRLPEYVRGHVGVVESVQPGHLLPDTHAVFEGENPQHVYTVRFDSHELWGEDAETFTLTVELYECYLETA